MMRKHFAIFMALFIATAYGLPQDISAPFSNSDEDLSISSDEDMSDVIDMELRKMWDSLMSRVKNVTFKVVNVPAEQMVVKSVCGPVSCLYDVVDFYNLTLPFLVPEIPDNTTFTFDYKTSTPLAPSVNTSSSVLPVSNSAKTKKDPKA